MIKIEQLYKRFGKVEVLHGINMDLGQAGVYAILGPNGSGKTTLIKCILGMVLADRGRIAVNGVDVRTDCQYRSRIDYLPQIAQFPGNLTVTELFRMIKNLRAMPSADSELIELFELTPHLGKKLSNLSGGTRQKVNIVLALMFQCEMLILDEPTTGLDPVSLIKLKKLIRDAREQGKIILITSHIMSFVEEMADGIVFLLDGRIHYEGSISRLKEQTAQTDLEHAIAHLLTENHV